MPAEVAITAVLRGHRLPKPDTCPENMYVLMLQCWQADASMRPDFVAILGAIRAIQATPVKTMVVHGSEDEDDIEVSL